MPALLMLSCPLQNSLQSRKNIRNMKHLLRLIFQLHTVQNRIALYHSLPFPNNPSLPKPFTVKGNIQSVRTNWWHSPINLVQVYSCNVSKTYTEVLLNTKVRLARTQGCFQHGHQQKAFKKSSLSCTLPRIGEKGTVSETANRHFYYLAFG